MSERMLALRLGFAYAALANFPYMMKERGFLRALRQIGREVRDAFRQ